MRRSCQRPTRRSTVISVKPIVLQPGTPAGHLATGSCWSGVRKDFRLQPRAVDTRSRRGCLRQTRLRLCKLHARFVHTAYGRALGYPLGARRCCMATDSEIRALRRNGELRLDAALYIGHLEGDWEMASECTRTALAAARDRGVRLGRYARVLSKRNREAAFRRAEQMRPIIKELRALGLPMVGFNFDHHFDHRGGGLTTTKADASGMPMSKNPTPAYRTDNLGHRTSELSRR
jgi:hypothetical protein